MPSLPAQSEGPRPWTIEEAEALIVSLSGVHAARIVARPGGEILEVHVLTNEEISPKQTVRNVESAMLAHFDLEIDHRKISVAQSSRSTRPEESTDPVVAVLHAPATEGARIIYRSHRTEAETPHRIEVRVTIEWEGRAFEGTAAAADLPKPRLEAAATATLRAMEELVQARINGDESRPPVALGLDGVKTVDAFDRRYVLVAVHALSGRDIANLAGSAASDDNLERATVMATLQATDRWVRGRLNG